MSEADGSSVVLGPVIGTMPYDQASSRPATPARLLELAVQGGAGIDQLERLMALQERWEANEARKAYTEAMNAFKAEKIEIKKAKLVEFTTRDGDTTSYKHAELSDVTDAIGPRMAAHQLSFRWTVEQGSGTITVSCVITHALGHSESVTMSAPPDSSGKKNAIQQVASTCTYLQRYTLLAAAGVATMGDDDDGRQAGIDALVQEAAEAIREAGSPDALKKVQRDFAGRFKLATDYREFSAAVRARGAELAK